MGDYSPYTWVEKQTKVGPTRMNAIEGGIADASHHHSFGLYASIPAADAAHLNWLYFALDHGVCYECQQIPGSAPAAYAWVPLTPRSHAGQDLLQPGVVGLNGGNDLAITTGGQTARFYAYWGAFWAFNAQGLLQRAVVPDPGTTPHIVPLDLLQAGDPTNPRFDRIGIVLGSERDGSMAQGSFFYLPGTPTAGATINNPAGAAPFAVPASLAGTSGEGRGTPILLADILVPPGVVQVGNCTIRDRRPWARGANRVVATNNSFTCTSVNAWQAIAGLGPVRLECAGSVMKLRLGMSSWSTANVGSFPIFGFLVDGAEPTGLIRKGQVNLPSANYREDLEMSWDYQPTAGSHLFTPVMAVTSGSHLIGDNPSSGGFGGHGGIDFAIWEMLRQNADNGSS